MTLTKRPGWHVEVPDDHAVIMEDDRAVATVEREEDATFIVNACNAHEDMLAALKAAEAHLGGPVVRIPSSDPDFAVLETIRAAIEKAEERIGR